MKAPVDVLSVQDPYFCGAVGWIAGRWHQLPWVVELCNVFFDLDALGAWRVERWLKAAGATWVAQRATRVRAAAVLAINW